ncbi:MAG TPA: succinylglutamate desuccinylase/aspartoacylase family protein [Planctomycetota bacterium]|nr:succinylglutamate desuccinylase/aspartoacylase family protein [Planctomycetota bacterium]
MLRRGLRMWLLSFAASVLALAAEQQSGTIAEGTPWATAWFAQDSGQPGPTVLIVGGVHGNEPAGARAAAQVRHWPIARGKLVVIPRANELGLREGTRLLPGGEDRDLNRNFPQEAGEEPRGELAKALWTFVGKVRPAWLLDLHEGIGARQQDAKTTGSSIIHDRRAATAAQAARVLEAVNATVADAGRKFVLLRGAARGALARAAAEQLNALTLILETTWKGQPLSLRTRQHRLMVYRFLTDLEMLAGSPDVLLPPKRSEGEVRVALYDAGGASSSADALEGKIAGMAKARVERVGPPEILAGALEQFDVLVIPGGGASRQATAITPEGREAIRKFVADGGGYVGVCAGAYLATCGYAWSLAILDARAVDTKHWQRGTGNVKIELTADGCRILGDRTGLIGIWYANGPLMAPASRPDIPDFTVLALFRSEINKNNAPQGVMLGTPAMACGAWGKGRVFVISVHPERTAGLDAFVRRAVQWAKQGEPR